MLKNWQTKKITFNARHDVAELMYCKYILWIGRKQITFDSVFITLQTEIGSFSETQKKNMQTTWVISYMPNNMCTIYKCGVDACLLRCGAEHEINIREHTHTLTHRHRKWITYIHTHCTGTERSMNSSTTGLHWILNYVHHSHRCAHISFYLCSIRFTIYPIFKSL